MREGGNLDFSEEGGRCRVFVMFRGGGIRRLGELVFFVGVTESLFFI